MKVCVYTAVFGTVKDTPRPPPAARGVSYVCFTDRPGGFPGWDCRPAEFAHPASTRRTARAHKLTPHLTLPGYDAWVWVDACLEFTIRDPGLFVLTHAAYPVWAFRHPHRDCVYREAEACKRFRKDDPAVLDRQAAAYRARGWPERAGLAETACLILHAGRQTERLLEEWWEEVTEFSLRDQVSFPVAAADAQCPWATLEGCRDRSPYFTFHPHVHHGDKR